MIAPGVTVVPLVTATEEPAPPELPSGKQELVPIGGGFVAEADGWLWLVWRGETRRLGRADQEQVEGADAVRACIQRDRAGRKRYAS